MVLAADTPAASLVVLAAVAVLLVLARAPLARLVFASLAYMNDPRSRGERWARENAVLRSAFEWLFASAGVVFALYAILDAADVISLAAR